MTRTLYNNSPSHDVRPVIVYRPSAGTPKPPRPLLMLISRCRCFRDESVPLCSSRDGMDLVIHTVSRGLFV
ncbi:hypothetical protein IRJ41_004093 [Triplophysa rosa]|uniref:Uncharacterized protein n=1 Tax=Triplophysa rosa TaxID=992332 RepID=A0A9W7TXJ1_TRIRA|nr:hypothetical protein IRJ41_004093 [Triplophysa rosa]